jgi:sugar phosphate isomerase/epimerase
MLVSPTMELTTSVSRRTFLAIAGALPFAARSAAQTTKIPVGIELYSVRGELKRDLAGTVTAVAKMGYEVVEFYSPYLEWTVDQARATRKLLDDLGIKCLSTHNSRQAISSDALPKAIELNQIIGSKAIVVASPGKVTTLDGWKALASELSAAAERLRPLGMVTGFHNHQLEWRVIEGDQRPMDVLAAGTPKDVVLQLDLGTCVEAGADPIAWIKANPGRIRSLHLKDWGAGEGRGYNVAFGDGDVPWKGIFAAAEAVGGVEVYLIEQEHAGSAGELAMAQRCLDNYKKLRA